MPPHSRFNSTLVRLKGLHLPRDHRPDRLFQFHAGSIKAWRARSASSAFFSFNSTLVRLKVARCAKARQVCQVSIPRWFD